MIPAWITNPVTIPPIFAFTYWVGRLLWRGPSVSTVYHQLVAAEGLARFSWYEFHNQFGRFLKMGVDVCMRLVSGGLIVGGVLGVASYPLVLYAVQAQRWALEAVHRRRLLRRKRSQPSTSDREVEAASGNRRRPSPSQPHARPVR